MQQLEERDYRPPFVTETDEIAWDDCTVCSTLMATATATLGETVYGQDWRPLTRAQLKALRERIRNHLGPGKQTGATNMADMREAFGKEYPWLPPIPFYDAQDSTWDEFIESLLKRNNVYVVLGNPAQVENKNSRLRRWTNNDNFGHAIYADHAIRRNGKVLVYIMDPLGRGEYDGEYVPAQELRQFIWKYGQFVKATAFPRGGWSRADRKAANLIERLRRVQQDLVEAERASANIAERLRAAQSAKQAAETAREVAANAAKVAEAARAACQIALGNLEKDNDSLESSLAAAIEARDVAISTARALESQVDSLNESVVSLEKEKATAESNLATAQATVAKQAETLKIRYAKIQELRKRLQECK